MKTNILSISILLLFICGIANAQSPQEKRLKQHVYLLASDSLRGRNAGSEDAAKAADYIIKQFEEIGVKPYFEEGWFQTFEKYGNTYKNIVGVLPGNDPVLKNEYLVIGAHYDHLGYYESTNADGTPKTVVYNGADDNASGTATEMGMDLSFGVGAYYGYLLNAGVKGEPALSVNPTQWGLAWSIGFQLGKIKFSGERRYQLNPLFVGPGAPKAYLRTGTVNLSYLF